MPKHFGGGERHVLSIAAYLSHQHTVSVAISSLTEITKAEDAMIRSAYETFFHLDLSRVHFIASPLFTTANPRKKLFWTGQWDALYCATDGSIFFSLAKKNYLHVQVPFTQPLTGLKNRLKLSQWQINTNSIFTRDVIEKYWQKQVADVHYPTVDLNLFVPNERKEKIILNVGRFIQSLNNKQQDVLVKAFRCLIDKYPKETAGWKLVLVGKVEEEDFARRVGKLAQGYPIEIFHNLEFDELRKMYSRAKIYWHAAGYNQDEYINPGNVEHFGISTLEAMSSGCVPIVINKGGLKEIIEHGVNGFVWNDLDGLIDKTLACIDETIDTKEISQKARSRASDFSFEAFYAKINKMFGLDETLLTPVLPHNLKVSVVIPTYNGQTLLAKNLPAVIKTMNDGDELIIVDDASNDQTLAWLKATFILKKTPDSPEFLYTIYEGRFSEASKKILVTVLLNTENMRFGESCNRGVKIAKNDLVFILNSDVKPQTDCLDTLRGHFSENKNPSLFGVNCLEVEKDARGKITYGGKNRLWFERGLFVHERLPTDVSEETAWGTGGSCLFDRSKWLALGGFDLDYRPAYWEDIDLSYRARRSGWKVIFDKEAVVEHKHETTNQSVFGQKKIEVMSFKNGMLFTWKNGSISQKIRFIFWMPYHLLFTNIRTSGNFGKAWLKFLYTYTQSV